MKFTAPVLRGLREPIRLEEVELDDPKPGEVLIRMAASGICHSCLHAQDGSWGPTLPMPAILGDEGSGTVEKVGDGVTHLQPGDPVIISWTPTCGRCHYCVIGRSNLCAAKGGPGLMTDGTTRLHANDDRIHHMGAVATYSPYTVVGASNAIKIRPDMPLDIAALIGCSVTTGVGSVLYAAKVGPGEALAVFGCGGVGLNAIQGGRLVNAWPLIAVDISDEKLEIAKALGATHTINPSRENVADRVTALTGRGLDYAVVTVGNAAATIQAWETMARGGVCVVIGVGRADEPLPIDARYLVTGERKLIGSSYGTSRPMEDFPRFVNLYLDGKLKIDELISRRYRLDEVQEAHDDLAAGRATRGLLVF
ncbi:MAG: Zn-dependent alcohol dehydrogenase [Chloroflexi bacterium]|nr:Zn-dependent alcohol dehydrogenase [Chloroflexota bacterium]